MTKSEEIFKAIEKGWDNSENTNDPIDTDTLNKIHKEVMFVVNNIVAELL